MNRDALILAHLPHVRGVANRLVSRMPVNVDFEDLVSDGTVGLITAADTFEETRGYKFWTFAEQRVRGAMVDGLRKQSWPRLLRQNRREIEAAREAFKTTHGCGPSVAELAAWMDRSQAWLTRNLFRIAELERGWDVPNAFMDVESLERFDLDYGPASHEESPHDYAERQEVVARVTRAIATLPARDQRLLLHYYGDELSMKRIGSVLGVNESRICQLHRRALTRVRQALAA